jgi:hypothetical protein
MPSIQMVAGQPLQPQGSKKKRTRNRKGKKGSHPSVPRNLAPRINAAAKRVVCDYVCSRVDPFCAASCGGKRADGGVPSIARTFRRYGYIAQYATGVGAGAIQIQPNLSAVYRDATAGTFTSFGSWGAIVGYNAAAYSKYRITSMGVHVYCVASPSTASGVTGVFSHTGTIESDVTAAGTLSSEVIRTSVYDAEYNHVFKGVGPEAENYVAISAGCSGWTSATIFFDAMAAVNDAKALAYDLVINCELTPAEETDYTEFATPAPQRNDMLEQLTINVEKKLPATTFTTPEKHSESVLATVGSAVEGFVRMAGPLALEGMAMLLV